MAVVPSPALAAEPGLPGALLMTATVGLEEAQVTAEVMS